MRRSRISFLILAALGLALVAPGWVVAADSSREAALRRELESLNKQIAEEQEKLDGQKAESASISRDVAILTSEIRKAQLEIDKRNVEIAQLGRDIDLKSKTVAELSAKLEDSKAGIAQLVRKMDQMDQEPLAAALVSDVTLAELFGDYEIYSSTQLALGDLIGEIRSLRGETEKERENLSARQEKARQLKGEIESRRKTIAAKEAEKKTLLSASKATEAGYESVLAEKRKQAAAIRAALFKLRDTTGISFGDAVDYATVAGKSTGVRPAFILAILKQETDLGNNVGPCNRDIDPPEKHWENIMPGPGDNSSRDDQTIYLALMKRLGRDPDSTPLSCPWGNGWGGAMGPSQFIPTTWKAYASRIEDALGVDVADPWIPEHAFTATAIYVKDLGAGAQTYAAERTAALKYYSGGNWQLPQNAFYGNQVMAHADEFQRQIDFLKDADSS